MTAMQEYDIAVIGGGIAGASVAWRLAGQRRVVLTVNQFFTAGRVVARSNLLSVLPRHFVRETGMAQELVVRKLPFEAPPVHVEAIWHRRAQHDPAHQWLRQALARVASASFGTQ